MADAAALPTDLKFVANKLRLGRPLESYYRLHALLGLPSEEDLTKLRAGGEAAIAAEVLGGANQPPPNGPTDAFGWTDADWLRYVQEERAGQPSKPRRGTRLPPLDDGNETKTLDDFVAHPLAVAAKLTRAHVLAMRLQSCPAFYSRLSRPFYEGCSRDAPHPYPALVAILIHAWQRLRHAVEEKPNLFAKFGALGVSETDSSKPVLWRVFNSGEDVNEYKQRGCLEMGFLSCFKHKATAERHAFALSRTESHRLEKPTLLRVRTEHVVDLSIFSVSAAEGECLLPPCTYLDLRSEASVNCFVDGHEVGFKVVDAVPHLLDGLPKDPSLTKTEPAPAAADRPSTK